MPNAKYAHFTNAAPYPNGELHHCGMNKISYA